MLNILKNSEICNNGKHGIAIYEDGFTNEVLDNKWEDNIGYQVYVSENACTNLKKIK